MKPGPQSIPRIPATARAPPPCQSFVCTSQASDKNSPLHRPFELAASLRSDPFTHEQFLNQPCVAHSFRAIFVASAAVCFYCRF